MSDNIEYLLPDDLPFVKAVENGMCYWSVNTEPDLALAYHLGMNYARICCRYMSDNEAPIYLQKVMNDLFKNNDDLGSIEVSFIQSIGMYAQLGYQTICKLNTKKNS